MGIFSKINFGLGKTRNKMAGAIDEMLDAFDSFEDDLFIELEEILVMSDVGVNTAVQVVEELRARVKSEKIKRANYNINVPQNERRKQNESCYLYAVREQRETARLDQATTD